MEFGGLERKKRQLCQERERGRESELSVLRKKGERKVIKKTWDIRGTRGQGEVTSTSRHKIYRRK